MLKQCRHDIIYLPIKQNGLDAAKVQHCPLQMTLKQCKILDAYGRISEVTHNLYVIQHCFNIGSM